MHLFGKRFSVPGTSPGTLIAHPLRRVEQVALSVLAYGPDEVEEKTVASVDEALSRIGPDRVCWIHAVGLHEVGVLEELGSRLGLHSLTLEDVLNTGQRPKLEDYGDYQFLVMRHLELGEGLESEQVSLFLGPSWVLSVQAAPTGTFDPVRERIRGGKGRIRKMGACYLVYALIDTLVDSLFPLLETYGERIQELDERLLQNPSPEVLETIHEVKKDLLVLRRTAWPQREVIAALERQQTDLVRPETRFFLRDTYDHSIQILDMLETYRDLASGLTDLYLSSVSYRMNEIMKVLTIMATIFIPLTFVAGVYGMNFDPLASPWNMPELRAYWGYPAVWAVMLAIAGGLFLFFRHKRWL